MRYTDEYGVWEEEGLVKILLEPTEKWLIENGYIKSDEAIKEEQIKLYKQELQELDIIVPRIMEDIIEQGNFKLHQSKLDIIARKKELRKKLI